MPSEWRHTTHTWPGVQPTRGQACNPIQPTLGQACNLRLQPEGVPSQAVQPIPGPQVCMRWPGLQPEGRGCSEFQQAGCHVSGLRQSTLQVPGLLAVGSCVAAGWQWAPALQAAPCRFPDSHGLLVGSVGRSGLLRCRLRQPTWQAPGLARTLPVGFLVAAGSWVAREAPGQAVGLHQARPWVQTGSLGASRLLLDSWITVGFAAHRSRLLRCG